MDVIILEGPQGKRYVPSGVVYRRLPGEKIVGVKNTGKVRGSIRKCSNCKRMGVFEYT